MRAFPPILEVFDHEAMPHWRTGAFWCSTDTRTALPGLIVGVVFSLYVLIGAEILGVALIAFFEPGNALHSFGAFLAEDAAQPHQFIFDFLAYGLCIVMGENIARVSLDIAANRPFRKANSARFVRAGIAGGVLVLGLLAVGVAEKEFGGPEFTVAGAGVLAAIIAAASFVSLAGAFRQGARMQEEQDFTV